MRFSQIHATVILSFAGLSFAGGLAHNTNQSIDFVRNFAQDASTGVQAAYYNPAGLAFGNDGWHFAVHNQTIWQTRTLTAQGLGEYDGKSFVPTMPSLFVNWHRGSWNAFGGFMISGGGGGVDFDDGLPIIDALLSSKLNANAQLAGLMKQTGLSATDLYDAEFSGSQYIFGFLLGGAYQINDMFSVALGARINYATNSYEGKTTSALDSGLKSVVGEDTYAALNSQLSQTLLDCDQTGFGVTPVIGVDFHYRKLNVGVKYEYNTSIKVKNDTKEISETVAALLPQFKDGETVDNDMPGFLSVGASYAWLDWLRTSAGYHHYFDTRADYPEDKEKALTGDENEYVFGVEVDPIQKLTLSAGVQRTLYGLSDEYIEDISFNLNSWSFGGGFAYRVTDKLTFQAGYMVTLFDPWTKTDSATKIPTKYERTSQNVGVGLNLDI